MCTVPMATNVADCEKICQLVAKTGLKYMMAETVVYSREFLFIKQMYEAGEFGKIQYMQASHPQDMDGWPEYWERMIPMHYATHVVSPVLGLVNGLAEYVSCFGSGRVRDDIREKSGNPFAVESCHIKIADSDVAAHIWRFLYDTARQYRESFDVYGSKKSFEWTLVEGESHVMHTAKRPEPEIPERDRSARLCPSVAEGDSAVHAIDRRRRAPVVPARLRARRLAPALGQRIRQRAARRSRSVAERADQCQLDERRHPGPRIGDGGRRNPAATGVHAKSVELSNRSHAEAQRTQRRLDKYCDDAQFGSCLLAPLRLCVRSISCQAESIMMTHLSVLSVVVASCWRWTPRRAAPRRTRFTRFSRCSFRISSFAKGPASAISIATA